MADYIKINGGWKEVFDIYCRDHSKHEIDKFHLDFSNADITKIPTIFK